MAGEVLTPEAALEDLLGLPEPEPTRSETRLTIHRTSPADVRDRQVIFSLDGVRVAELLYGQTFTCDVAPGTHQLRANNTLVWKTIEFLAPAGSHVHVTCINRAPRGMFMWMGVFGIAPLMLTLKVGRPEFVKP
jgi:hypothetical protein